MLRRFGVRVVGFGPSAEAGDAYVLLRAFPSLAARDEQEDRFYGSDEWVQHQREPVVSRIRSYHTVVLAPGAEAVDALTRRPGPGPGRRWTPAVSRRTLWTGGDGRRVAAIGELTAERGAPDPEQAGVLVLRGRHGDGEPTEHPVSTGSAV